MGWRTPKSIQDRKKRRALAKELSRALNSCKNEHDCLFIALKLAMLRIKYPGDCEDPLELLAMQLVASKDARDHEFILVHFPDLQAAHTAELEFAALNGGG